MKSTKIIYQITSILMALLMFFTSVGLTLDLHYCQGQLKTFNFFGKAKSCHEMGEGMKDCPHHKQMREAKQSHDNSISKKDCCSNKTLYIQSDQDQQFQVDNAVLINSQLQHFVIAFVEIFLKSALTETDDPTYVHYKSPLIARDVYALLESYLL